MTGFIIACAAMIAAALLWIVLPLLRTKSRGRRRLAQRAPHLGHRYRAVRARAGGDAVPTLSKWNWNEADAAMAREQQMDDLLGQLKAKLAENPNDVNGWLLLGRSYGTMEQVRARGRCLSERVRQVAAARTSRR